MIHGPRREVRAGQALREAEVVLDRCALPGLTAGRVAFDENDVETLGRAILLGSEPCGPRSHDAEVVQRLLGGRTQAERGRDVACGR